MPLDIGTFSINSHCPLYTADVEFISFWLGLYAPSFIYTYCIIISLGTYCDTVHCARLFSLLLDVQSCACNFQPLQMILTPLILYHYRHLLLACKTPVQNPVSFALLRVTIDQNTLTFITASGELIQFCTHI